MSASIPSWVRVGARCVCIAAPWFTKPEPGYSHPVVGGTYTVSGTQFSPARNKWGVSFAEGHRNDVYGVDNFRPIATTEAEDVALFRDLITKRQPVAA
jgi:hypothetical protein